MRVTLAMGNDLATVCSFNNLCIEMANNQGWVQIFCNVDTIDAFKQKVLNAIVFGTELFKVVGGPHTWSF